MNKYASYESIQALTKYKNLIKILFKIRWKKFVESEYDDILYSKWKKQKLNIISVWFLKYDKDIIIIITTDFNLLYLYKTKV